jgi:DNA-binding response OmpR family regulator
LAKLRFRYGAFELDSEGLSLKGPNGDFQLTSLEADVLREFMTKPGEVLSREYLLEKVWGMKGTIETRTVDNFIVRLRRYLEENPAEPAHLVSVRGRGYRLEDLSKSGPSTDA